MNTHTPQATEQSLDAKLAETHDKRQYSFTEDERSKIRQIDTTKQYLLQVAELQIGQVLAGAMQRVKQPVTPQTSIHYDMNDNLFFVYNPKKSV